jgi:hypothetical protein
MSRSAIRRIFEAPIGFALRASILTALVSAPLAAAAAPIFFTGPTNSDGFVLGVSEEDALTSGLAIVVAPPEVAGENLVFDETGSARDLFIEEDASGATQDYLVTNVTFDPDIAGDLYLVIKSVDDAVVNGFAHEYDPSTVGLDLTAPWFIVSYYDDVLDQTLYFPTISLGDLAMGDSTAVSIDFVLTEPVSYVSLEGSLTATLMLPQLLFDGAFVPVPEPATGMMLAMGLGGLAWSGRRRPCRGA